MKKKNQSPKQSSPPKPPPGEESRPDADRVKDDTARMIRAHVRLGWWSLLVFLTLGMLLETLHGFKIGWYLETANTTRRLMFTLAHAHGVLISLVHLGFAFSLSWKPVWPGSSKRIASATLNASVVLIPGGFFLGGVWIYGGDPGLGILLVPLGALCLFTAVLLTARHAGRRD